MSEKIFEGIYLFSDIDGTLASTGSMIPESNRQAIQYFVDEGGTFGVATGRYLGDIQLLDDLPVNGFGLLNNGAGIYDFKKKELRSTRTLPENIMKHYLPLFEKNQDYGLLLVNDEGYLTIKLDGQPRPILDGRYALRTLEEVAEPYYKIMFIVAEEEITGLLSELNGMGIPDVDYVQTGERTIEVVPQGASKGDAFLELQREFHLPTDKTYFIGDSFNDITFLDHAGYSACVAHAPEAVKSHCDFVTCKFDQGAVGHFINHIEHRLKT